MGRLVGAGSSAVRALLLVVGVVGCGETKRLPPVLPEGVGVQISGSRLQAFAATSEQGPTIYLQALYDTEREEFCAFRRAADGAFRCFPTAVVRQVFDGNDACPDPLAVDGFQSTLSFPASRPPRYVEAGTSSICGGAIVEIYELGSIVSPEPPCDHLGVEGRDLYGRGRRVPDSAFVRAELVANEASEALGSQYLVASDGAAQWFSFFDHTYGEQCTIERLDDSVLHCLPASTVEGNYWGSAIGEVETCRPLVVESNVCGPTVFGRADMFGKVHKAVPADQESGTAFDTPTFRECLEGAHDFMRAPFALTEAVDAQEFPRMAETEVEQGQLTATVWGTEDGATLAPVRDDYRLRQGPDEACELAIASDGKERCLPWVPVDQFADGDCTEPLLSNPESGAFSRFAIRTTDGRTSVYRAGEPFSGTVYELTPSGQDTVTVCNVSDSGSDTEGLYRGVEVSPDEFVEYTRVVLRP